MHFAKGSIAILDNMVVGSKWMFWKKYLEETLSASINFKLERHFQKTGDEI